MSRYNKRIMKYLIPALVLVLLLPAYYLIESQRPVTINEAKNTFDEFLSINSVREHRLPWIEDQYQVAKNHRIFAMNAMTFTGEEILKGYHGRFYIIDKSVPHDEYPNDKMGFNPAKGAAGFNFDEFLTRMKENNLRSIPVLNGNLLYTNLEQDTLIPQSQLPWDDGGNRENPMDYKAFSSFLYQFTARYGRNKLISEGGTIDPSLIKVADNNEIKAGLNLLEALEPGNEMDMDWFTDKEKASTRDMAAFLSAAIDGHMGLMGPGHGIRNADPSMKIVFPGLIDVKSDYFLDVREELKAMRKDAPKYGYPVDPLTNFVINVHKYPEYGRIYRKLNDVKGRPIIEDSDVLKVSTEFVRKMREEFPDLEIYMTETGYDKMTAEEGRMGTPTAPGDSVTEMGISPRAQARQLARTALSMYASGYDRLYIFALKDPKAIGAGYYKIQFHTSGLIRKNGNKDRSWFVIDQLRKKLSGYMLKSYEISDKLHKMTFSKQGESDIAAVWLASVSGATQSILIEGDEVPGMGIYQLDSAHLSDGNIQFDTSKLEVNVTEFPTLIFL